MSDGTTSKPLPKLRCVSATQEGTGAEHYSGLGNLSSTTCTSLLTPISSPSYQQFVLEAFQQFIGLTICSGSFPRLKDQLLVCNSPLFKDRYCACRFLPRGTFPSPEWLGGAPRLLPPLTSCRTILCLCPFCLLHPT